MKALMGTGCRALTGLFLAAARLLLPDPAAAGAPAPVIKLQHAGCDSAAA